MSKQISNTSRRASAGFSLIELLTVIAIIAVLAALLFPVIASQRAKARRNACIANLGQISGGLRMYRLDNGAYPPALFGYVGGQKVVTGLYPHYVRSREDFVCPDNPVRAEMPARETMNMPGDPSNVGQVRLTPMVAAPELGTAKWTANGGASAAGIQFPMGDSYDISVLPTDALTTGKWERHYARQWVPMVDLTQTNLGSLPLMGDSPEEIARTYARQLTFRRPDDDTVVTDCTYHRNYPDNWRYGDPLPADSFDIVLFLDGHTEVRPSRELNVYQNNIPGGGPEWAGWQIKSR